MPICCRGHGLGPLGFGRVEIVEPPQAGPQDLQLGVPTGLSTSSKTGRDGPDSLSAPTT